MTDRNTEDVDDDVDEESHDVADEESHDAVDDGPGKEYDTFDDARDEADDPADVGEGHDYDVEGYDAEEHDVEEHDDQSGRLDSDDADEDVGREERLDRDDGFDRENAFERKDAVGREDGFEHEDAVEREASAEGEDANHSEDVLEPAGREKGVESSDPLGEPDRPSADDYGEPPQYFDPVAEPSTELPRSAEALRSKMLGLISSDAQSTDEERVDAEASTLAGLERARKVGTALDDAITVPGTSFKIGVDPILGILPGAGDAVAAVGSLYIVLEAARADVPRSTLMKMLALVAVDLVAGSVPVLGVLFDAFWKANKWNVASFEEHVQRDGL